MRDSFNREISYMRISVTDRCNQRCIYCMPEEGVSDLGHDKIISFEDIEKVVRAAVEIGINKFRLTGGEPLVRKGIVGLVDKLSKIAGVKELSMTTNGRLLGQYAHDLKLAGLNRVNISVDTLYEEKYAEITRGGDINEVMDGLDAAVAEGLTPIKINVVVMKGFNDDEILNFAQLTLNEALDIRFIELMPIGSAEISEKYSMMLSSEIKELLKGISPVESKNEVAEYYKYPEAVGRIGFISPMSHHFCDLCNKVRLTSDGKIKACLHTNEEYDLNELFKTGSHEDLVKGLSEAIFSKPDRHYLTDGAAPIKRDMNKIGG
jgi:GTP 3',8-cyclase